MRIRLVAVAALFASLATASAASAQVAPITMPIATPAPAPAPKYGQMASLTPMGTPTLGQAPIGVSWLAPPSPPKEQETIDDDIRERQEQMDRIMELMRQFQEQRDAVARRTAGG